MTFSPFPPAPQATSDQPLISVSSTRLYLYVNAASMRCLGLGANAEPRTVAVQLMIDRDANRAALRVVEQLDNAPSKTHNLTKLGSGGRIECAPFIRELLAPNTEALGRHVLRLPASWNSRRKMLVFGPIAPRAEAAVEHSKTS